jgi:hypothetical protein
MAKATELEALTEHLDTLEDDLRGLSLKAANCSSLVPCENETDPATRQARPPAPRTTFRTRQQPSVHDAR